MWKTVAPMLPCIFLFLAAPASSSEAVEDNAGNKLSLTTDYLFERVDVAKTGFGGHWLRLHVTLDKKGNGKGTLDIDPNIQGYNEFGDPTDVTQIAIKNVDITVEAVKLDDPAKKGRRLYEIKGKELKTRLFLVVSPKEAGPNRLIVHGNDKVYVFELKDV
jgi:hypothetical protein